MWYQALIDDIFINRNEEKALAMSKYMRNQFAFLGVTRPERELIYKRYFKNMGESVDWDFLQLCFSLDAREYQYLGIDYLNKQRSLLTVDALPRIYKLIIMKSWWDSVDGFPRIVGEIVKKNSFAKDILLEWSLDDNFWVRRVAILHQLLFKEQTDVHLLENIILNNLGSKEFFINKAIGWILRDYSKTDKEWVISFINKYRDRLDKLSIREGSKYLNN